MTRACLPAVVLWFSFLPSTQAEEPRPPKLRLGNAARPVGYAARLRVVPSEPTFDAAIDIDLAIQMPAEVLWLDGTNLTVRAASFEIAGKKLPAKTVDGGVDFIGFTAGSVLPTGPARLHVEYSGSLSRKDDRGLFAQKEGDRWYAITQLESIFARRVFPCFDEPAFKAPWQLTIEVPKDQVVLSNTAVVSQREEHPGMKTVAFARTVPLSSYLVAFAVGPYELVDAGTAGARKTPIRIAVPFGRSGDVRHARSVTGTLLERLEAYFGTPYPYDKLDLVTIPLPSQFSAMENPGMITFDQAYLVAKAEDDTLTFARSFGHNTTHEIAHQWFGDLVTMAWWDDIWLNESFADWMENKIVEELHPEWHHGTAIIRVRGRAMSSDSLVTARKIRQPIESDDDILNGFDAITYSKGAAVLGMFEQLVGREAFQQGVRRYIADHAGGNATADDFVAAISAAAGRDLGPMFRSFLDQAGAPLVTVALSCGAGRPATLTLAQRRYVRLGSGAAAPQTWHVPMCARWTGGSACAVLDGAEGTLPLAGAKGCPAWVLANAGEIGYYRVAYQGDLLARLLGPARAELTLAEILGLLGDVNALVDGGVLPIGDALALLGPLAADPRREVVSFAATLVAGLRDNLVPSSLLPKLARLVQKFFGARARELGWVVRDGDDEETRLLRPTLVALVADLGGDAKLRAEAVALARRWLDDRNAVDSDVVESLLAVAARTNDRALFDRIVAEVHRAPERSHRRRMLTALGQFQAPELATAALALVFDENIDARESAEVFWTQSQRRETRERAWTFVKERFDALAARLPPEEVAYLPYTAIAICDDAHRVEMRAFFKDRSPKLPGGPRVLEQATERMAQCQAYVQAHRASAVKFVSKY